MILQKHHSFRYILDRSFQWIYFKLNSDKPWMCKDVNRFLQNYLNSEKSLLEYGCGRSTVFYAKRVKSVFSVETDKKWFEKVKLFTSSISNVNLNLFPYERTSYIQSFKPESFDVIVNDAKYRDLVALDALSTLKRGGILVIDNAERYLASGLNLPLNGYVVSCGSEVEIENWADFTLSTASWKSKWYSDGVSATLVLTKPA